MRITKPDDVLARRHHHRWRKIANQFPRQVADAFDGELELALTMTDRAVLEYVAQWESDNDMLVRDWLGIGRLTEGRDADESTGLTTGYAQGYDDGYEAAVADSRELV